MIKGYIPLLVIGDFAWDVLIRTNEKLEIGGDVFGEVMVTAGGSAANTAVWAQRCGIKTYFIGKIGKDQFGRLARENLEKEKVENHFIYTDEHRTAAVAVWIDKTGQRSMVSGQGADFYLLPSELPINIIRRCKHVHITGWSLFTDPPRSAIFSAVHQVKMAGGTVSLDPGSYQMIKKIGKNVFNKTLKEIKPDIFFPNTEEGKIISGKNENSQKIISRLIEMMPDTIVVLKLDANGAMIGHRKKSDQLRPATETIIDATGAGDAFAGSFLAKYLSGKSALESGRFAVEISSWVINQIGARPKPDIHLRKLIKPD